MTERKLFRFKGIGLRTRENLYGYGFVSLWIIGFVVFTMIPLVQTFLFSVNQVTVTRHRHRPATGAMGQLFTCPGHRPDLCRIANRICHRNIGSVPIAIIFSLIIALFLNMNFKFKGFFRTIFFLPVVITSGPVIQELTAQGATSVPGVANLGVITEFLSTLPSYLSNPVEYLLTSFIQILWFSGVQILIYLSSLQKIDKSIYEAASIDGASAWESFWKITLPSLSTTTLINAIYTIITLSHFSENKVIKYIFSQTYAVQGGIGYSSAMSFLFLFVLLLLLAIVFLVLSPRRPRRA